MKVPFKRILAAAAIPLLLLTGCKNSGPVSSLQPSEDSQEEESENTRVVLPDNFTLPYEPNQSLDPVTCPDGVQQTVGSLLYEGLFRLDETLTPQPWLCTSYQYDPATYTYTFTLRSGVLFSDGSAFTAADAAATLRRAMNSDRYRTRLYQVTDVSGSGSTLTVVLSGPNTSFPALLDIPIVKAGTETSLTPIGTGPYQFTSGESSSRLTANPNWWNGGALPVQQIFLSAAEDRDTLLYQFSSHDIQLLTADLTGTDPITATGNTSFQDVDTTVLQYVGINVNRAPFDNAALRKALNLGINRASLISAFLSGHGSAAQFPVSPVSPLYPSELESVYSYDAFASAMSAAGYNTGSSSRTVKLLVNEENSFKVSIANYLAESLSVFDLKIEVEALPWDEYIAALSAGNFDLYYGEVKLTADWNLIRLLGTSGSLNYGRWSDAQTDQLLAAYASSTDQAAAMKTLCAYLQEQSPILPVCFKSNSVLYQTGVVENLSPTMTEPFYNLSNCIIHLKSNSST